MALFDQLAPLLLPGFLPDRIATELLLKYDTMDPMRLGQGELQYLLDHGYATERRLLTHDEIVQDAILTARHSKQESYVQAFVAGTGQARFDWIAGLAAFAILRQMPEHTFVAGSPDAIACQLCGSHRQRKVDLTFLNQCRFSIGGLVGGDIYHLWLYVSLGAKLPLIVPSSKDRENFRRLLDAIRATPPRMTARDVAKQLRTVFPYKTTSDQRKSWLESLGCCGVLETAQYKGYLTAYINPGLAPRKSRSSDWAYPIDWWIGSDGINEFALQHWFGTVL